MNWAQWLFLIGAVEAALAGLAAFMTGDNGGNFMKAWGFVNIVAAVILAIVSAFIYTPHLWSWLGAL